MDYYKIDAVIKKVIKQGAVDRLIEKIDEIRTMIQDDRSDEDIKMFFMGLFEEAKKTKKRTPTKPTSKEEGDGETHPIFQLTPEEFIENIIEKKKYACSWYRKKGKLTDGTDCAGKVCGRPMTREECLGPDGNELPYYTWRCSGPCKRNTKDTQNRAMEKLYNAVCTNKAVFASPVKHGNTPVSGEQDGDLPTRAEEVSGISRSGVSPTSFLSGEKTGLASPSASRGKSSPKPPAFKLIKITNGDEKVKTDFAVSKSPLVERCLCYSSKKKKVCGAFDFVSPPPEFDGLFLQDVKKLDSTELQDIAKMGLEYEYMGQSRDGKTVFDGEELELGLEIDEPDEGLDTDNNSVENDVQGVEEDEDEDDAMAALLGQLEAE